MKKTVVTSESDPSLISLTANVPAAGVPTPAFTFTVPRGAEFAIPNTFESRNGVRSGFAVILDLNKANGSRISGSSKIAIEVVGPGWESPKVYRTIPYAIFQQITRKEQNNEQFRDTIAPQVDLNVGNGLVLMQDFKFRFSVQGPDAIDWTRSYVQFMALEGKPGEFSGVK